MKSAQSPTTDFNQMLVVSVFFHFLLFTTFMFLPQTQEVVRRIKPAFMVSFVDIPAGPETPSAPAVKPAPVAPMPPKPPVAEKPKPVPKPVVKSVPKPKPEPKPVPVPEKPAASKALVSKLDELARLEKKKTIPKKDKTAMVAPKPKESVLEDFEKMKMKTATEKKKKPIRKKTAKDDLALKELEFEHLSKQSATHQSQDKSKKKSSLLEELEKLDQMSKQAHAALDKPKIERADPKAAELLKRLETIKKESSQIKIDTSKLSSRHSQKFKSGIRNLKIAKMPKGAMPSSSGDLGDPGANALSLYLGKAQIQINEQWKDPLGGGIGKVQVSFTIFPKGNISTPKIVKSSGDSKLDTLAIRAVKNAAPLPPFPKEIKEPNLPFIFEFTYETSKK